MIRIAIPSLERFDEARQMFVCTREQTLQLEHSLVSISKWESRWCRAFLDKKDKTYEETIDYVRCMTITQNVDPLVYHSLTDENIADIERYINAPMTATCFSGDGVCGVSREKITAELIYYWMISLNIPFECQKWHLNRLITLIRVCDIKNRPPKRMSRNSIMRRNSALNAKRRRQLNTRG